MKHTRFEPVTPHIHKLNLPWWGCPIAVWLVRHGKEWSLVDAGPPGCAGILLPAVEAYIGGVPDRVIITHGHLDHVGALPEIVQQWPLPVLAHVKEFPYMTGTARYSNIESCRWSYRLLAKMIPSQACNIPDLQELKSGDICGGLEVIHVPGHAPGMIALLHVGDEALIAADTFRFKPFSAMPFFTYDREEARRSMQKLATCNFKHLLVSHGQPLLGDGQQKAKEAAFDQR